MYGTCVYPTTPKVCPRCAPNWKISVPVVMITWHDGTFDPVVISHFSSSSSLTISSFCKSSLWKQWWKEVFCCNDFGRNSQGRGFKLLVFLSQCPGNVGIAGWFACLWSTFAFLQYFAVLVFHFLYFLFNFFTLSPHCILVHSKLVLLFLVLFIVTLLVAYAYLLKNWISFPPPFSSDLTLFKSLLAAAMVFWAKPLVQIFHQPTWHDSLARVYADNASSAVSCHACHVRILLPV